LGAAVGTLASRRGVAGTASTVNGPRLQARDVPPRAAFALEQAGAHPLLARLLAARGVREAGELDDALTQLLPPQGLRGIDAAARLLADTLSAGQRLCVVADYDCDGATACAVLLRGLGLLGAAPGTLHYVVPDRALHGYGLTPTIVDLALTKQPALLVTVDNGIASLAGVAHARASGLKVLVTDHHLPAKDGAAVLLPDADVIVNPNQPDCGFASKALAGVGVVFYVLLATRAELRGRGAFDAGSQPRLDALLDLVALGTVADLAPLTGENRALVCRGLERLRQARRPGVAAMFAEAQLRPETVTAGTVGFVLGPRLNAAGRLDNAMASYNLLTTPAPEEAGQLAQKLGAQNRERQQLMLQMVEQARQEVLKRGDEPVYVLASPAYAVGIAGLVASRITEEFYRPSIVIALDENESKGSARSISAFHITQALDTCKDLLVKHGGHAAAAGLTIKNENIDALREALNHIAQEQLTDEDWIPALKIDGTLSLPQVNGETWALLEGLQPFGMGNPTPTFVSHNAQLREARPVGSERPALKLKLSDGRAVWDAIYFGEVASERLTARIDVVYTMQSRTWNGQDRLELVVKDLRPTEG